MSQRILKILKREGKSIGCVFDGALFSDLSPAQLSRLLQQLNQIGNIRKSIVIFAKQLPKEQYEYFISRGIRPLIVPSDTDIHIALEVLEQLYYSSLDILCVGVCNDDLLPIVITMREEKETLVVAPTQPIAERYLPYADYLIITSQIE
ncbi:MAG: hypothetical protein ACTSYD_15165 [Candidatus Heimdallarchaeaceae archaeon]